MRHVSMLINYPTFTPSGASVDRVAGYSDGWYDSIESDGQVISARDRQLINLRAALLPQAATIVAYRISLLDEFGKSKGRSRVYKMNVSGGFATEASDPRQAFKYTLFGNGTTNECQAYIQGVPTARIKNGSYNPALGWQLDVKTYFDFLFANGYRFFGYDQSLAVAPIIRIVTNPDPDIKVGTVTLERNNVWAAGNTVRVIDSRTDLRGNYRQNVNGHQVLTSVGLTLTLANWTAGSCTGGRMTYWDKVLLTPFIDDAAINAPLLCTRKIGKPFFQFRGRASSRA